MMRILIQKKTDYLICVTKWPILLVLLVNSNVMLTGQVAEDSAKKSSGLKAKILGENLIIIDNSTGHLALELAVDELRKAADSLGQAFGFQTIFQGMYLHIGSQPEELRTAIQDYNLANLDTGRPAVALFAKNTLDGQSTILEDRVEWFSNPELNSVSTNKRRLIQDLAREAANAYLEENPSEIIKSAEIYITTFLEQLLNPPKHYFYIKQKFYGPEDIFYISISNESFPILVYTEEDKLANNLLNPIEEFRFILNSASRKIINEDVEPPSLSPISASGNSGGSLIKAEFEIDGTGEKELAATRIVVVDVDFVQNIENADSPFDDNQIVHYSTFSNHINGNRTRYKYLMHPQTETIELSIRPNDVPLDSISLTRGAAETPILVNGRKHSFHLTSAINDHNPVTANFGGEPLRRLNLRTLPTKEIPISFIVLHARITRPNGTTRIRSTRTLRLGRAERSVRQANEILGKIGLSLRLAEGFEILVDTMDNNDDVIDYTTRVGATNPELDRIMALPLVDTLRRRGILPVLMVEKLSNSGIPGTTDTGLPQGPVGISFTGRFVSLLSQDPPPGIPIHEGRNLAHEIGHAYLSLGHPFTRYAGFNQGDDIHNLMDYNHDDTQKYFRAYQFNIFNFVNIISN